MAVVISMILSLYPIISAIPVSIFLLFIFITTRIPNLEKTVSIILISSTSFKSDVEPTISASH